jgi:hypothetical protein
MDAQQLTPSVFRLPFAVGEAGQGYDIGEVTDIVSHGRLLATR